MRKSAVNLPESSRKKVVETLNQSLADGIDLYGQIKVAHWNLKGALFASLHPLFDSFAGTVSDHNDTIAERAVVLGGLAKGVLSHVVQTTRLPKYPADTTKDLEHVQLLVKSLNAYLEGIHGACDIADKQKDSVTVDMLNAIAMEHEKQVWFLLATLDK